MENIKFIIGQRIRNYRIQKNLSQEQLSELASCHPTYIGQLERGEKNATLESIQKVAQALDIPLSQLFEKIEEKQNEESIPLQIYDFFSSKNKKEQKYLYQILKEIDDYKSLGNISEESLVLSSLLELREAIESILKRISKIELEVYEKVTQLKSEEEISIIRESVNKEYENIDKCIKEIEDRLGR